MRNPFANIGFIEACLELSQITDKAVFTSECLERINEVFAYIQTLESSIIDANGYTALMEARIKANSED